MLFEAILFKGGDIFRFLRHHYIKHQKRKKDAATIEVLQLVIYELHIKMIMEQMKNKNKLRGIK
jgi:hypothetical protein